MANKNIILNFTLEKYNKKYRNRRYRLLKYSKKEVEDFDKRHGHYVFDNKTYNLEINNYLLKDRKWALIDDTYYEIPRPIRFIWFINLNAAVQAITCLIGVGAVSSAIVVPTLMFTVWNKGGDTPTPTPEPLKPLDFKTCSWDDVAIRCTKLENGEITENEFYNLFTYDGNPISSKEDFIGKERIVKVNGQDHKVRVIDVQHGKNESDPGNKDLIVENGVVTNKVAALTFEFANLISDSNGYSLAYIWNDTNNTSIANYDYINSSIRYALTGKGTNNGNSTILAGVKGNTNWDSDYKNKTIYSMLPSTFTNKLKTVKKSVGTTSSYTETEYSDKLFMLSTIEMGYTDPDGYDKGFGKTYTYYNGHPEDDDLIRIKKQVSSEESMCTQISYDKGQKYQDGPVYNYAGYNENPYGGAYWLRSPSSFDSLRAWYCFNEGIHYYAANVYSGAFGVAPAFCL